MGGTALGGNRLGRQAHDNEQEDSMPGIPTGIKTGLGSLQHETPHLAELKGQPTRKWLLVSSWSSGLPVPGQAQQPQAGLAGGPREPARNL